MGRENRPWQDVDYVSRYFGKTAHSARKAYFSYVEAGLDQGWRDELTRGRLIWSLGGWAEVEKLRLKVQNHIKGDERILGDSDFVDSVVSQVGETYDRHHELRRRGYDLNRIAERVGVICEMDPDDVFSRDKQQEKVKARSLVCFWAARELGISLTELARHLGISVQGVGYAVEGGKAIARDNNYQLIQ